MQSASFVNPFSIDGFSAFWEGVNRPRSFLGLLGEFEVYGFTNHGNGLHGFCVCGAPVRGKGKSGLCHKCASVAAALRRRWG
jgi:hypothetical protein